MAGTAAEGAPILEMRSITKSFGGIRALRDVSFACRRGTVHAILGENGAGKSTLMKILAGAYQADSGEILLDGTRYTTLTTRQALDLGIRIIHQELNLLPEMTVDENIFLGEEPRGSFGLIDKRAMQARSRALLVQLGVEIATDTPVGELTVAGQQMVEIAKAISQDARLLIMDEPSAILAGHELEQLFATIASLKAQGVTIIYISHRLQEIFQVADEVTVLKDGAVVGTAPIGAVTRAQLVQMMVGRPMEEIFPPREGRRGEAVLRASGISTRRSASGTGSSVRNVSLTLYAGEIVGLAGMVGSGRTELARALFGADALAAGRVEFVKPGAAGSAHRPTPARSIKRGLTLVPEDRKGQGLFIDHSIRRNLTLPILARLARWGVIQRGSEDAAVENQRRSLAIQMRSPEQEVRLLSGGNQQKVVLGRWLETGPQVLLLDEPTRGIDVGAKFEIYQLMRDLAGQGVAILMISSDLTEILGMSDRILVMHNGECVGELDPSEATEERIVELATTGGLEAVAHGSEI